MTRGKELTGMSIKGLQSELAYYQTENQYYAYMYNRVVNKPQRKVGELRNKLRYHRLED